MSYLLAIIYISVTELTTKRFWTRSEKFIIFFIKKKPLSIQNIYIVVMDNKCDWACIHFTVLTSTITR